MPESAQKNNPRPVLIKYASRLLLARPYFCHQLQTKLILRAQKLNLHEATQVIDGILTDLERSGYLQDQYLAEAFVRRQLDKGYGPRIISLKLKRHGLPQSSIKLALQSAAGSEATVNSIKQYCAKHPHLNPRRLQSRLYSRGFPSHLLWKIFDVDHIGD